MSNAPVVSISAPACPHCGQPVSASDINCPSCGTNIALALLVAERGILDRTRATGPAGPVSLEQLVPRLGDFLVRKGYITEAQLHTALAQQAAAPPDQPRSLLGQTLVTTGMLSHEDLDAAVADQVLELQNALLQANRSLEERVAARTAELETTLAKLQEFSQLKANFVSNISHELRTPLAQIKGYADLLAEAMLGPLTDEQGNALKVTQAAIERLERLINDLISYASAAKGEMVLHLQPVSAATLIAEAASKHQARAEKKKVSLAAEVPAGLPPVMADHDKFAWVVSQLVDNGLKFTPAGGRVTVGANLDGTGVVIFVRDTGIGIPPQRLVEIFEPFQQLDGSSTRRYGGTGLGLALVRRIVEAHDSTVNVESEEGRGTTVSFALRQPAADEN